MKKIEAAVRPCKVDELTAALAKAGVGDLTLSEVEDYGHHPRRVEYYRGIEYVEEFRSEIKVEIVVEDEQVRVVTEAISAALQTGHYEESRLIILPLEAVFHRRAGVR